MLTNILSKIIKFIGGQEYLTIQLDITNSCNLQCVHCYHPNHLNHGAISVEDWIEIISQYRKLLIKLCLKPSFVICGGEPLLNIKDKLVPLIAEIRREWINAPITLLTNGTLLNKTNIDFLKSNDIEIQVSLDGANAETHDLKRGQGTFNKSIEGIRFALENNINVHLLTILSKKSSFWIRDIFEVASCLGVNSLNFTRLIPSGNGKKMVLSEIDQPLIGNDLRDAYISIVNNSKHYRVKTNTDKPLFCLIDKSLGGHSKFGFQGLVVDYKGNLKVSSRTDFILGNILNEGLENLFLKHPILIKLRREKINSCGKCEYYSQCGGDRNFSYATNGNFFEFDQGCWKQQIVI